MADKKITQLTNITGANLVDADEFVVVDISADETKAITLGELKEAFDSGSGFVRITGDTMTGDLTVPNVITSGNVDGRDISVDGTKLDTIETNADVTDTTNVTSAGALMTTGGTMTGDVAYGDNVKATFGASADLAIFHDGSNSYITDNGAGQLILRGSNSIALNNADNSKNMVVANDGGEVSLYHNGSSKLATTSTGINVTGGVVADGAQIDGTVTINGTGRISSNGSIVYTIDSDNTGTGSGHYFRSDAGINRFTVFESGDISFYEDTGTTPELIWDASATTLAFGDNVKATFGSSADLQLWHNGSNSLIQDTGTGILEITSNGSQIKLSGNGSTSASFYINGESQLFCAGALKLATKSNGIDVTGNVGLSGSVDFGDWTITESGGSLYFATGGTNKMKLDASGNLDVVGSVNSNATIT